MMPASYRNPKKLLIVDDDISVRETLSRFLLSQGFSVESAENGCAALEILSHFSFDLLIVDAHMPRMNGIELLKCLKEKRIATPAIFISGLLNKEMRKEARRLKVVGIIEKPFALKEIFCNILLGLELTRQLN
jgi:DNA-binding response OmpR family regulator